MCMIDDAFRYADIHTVALTDDDTVLVQATVRKTGAAIIVEGSDLDDASGKLMDQVLDHVYTVEAILSDYGLTLDELRALVDLQPIGREWDLAPHASRGPVYDPNEYGDYDDEREDWDFTPSSRLEDATAEAMTPQESLDAAVVDQPILAAPLQLVAAAQPFLAVDEQKNLYMALLLEKGIEG